MTRTAKHDRDRGVSPFQHHAILAKAYGHQWSEIRSLARRLEPVFQRYANNADYFRSQPESRHIKLRHAATQMLLALSQVASYVTKCFGSFKLFELEAMEPVLESAVLILQEIRRVEADPNEVKSVLEAHMTQVAQEQLQKAGAKIRFEHEFFDAKRACAAWAEFLKACHMLGVSESVLQSFDPKKLCYEPDVPVRTAGHSGNESDEAGRVTPESYYSPMMPSIKFNSHDGRTWNGYYEYPSDSLESEDSSLRDELLAPDEGEIEVKGRHDGRKRKFEEVRGYPSNENGKKRRYDSRESKYDGRKRKFEESWDASVHGGKKGRLEENPIGSDDSESELSSLDSEIRSFGLPTPEASTYGESNERRSVSYKRMFNDDSEDSSGKHFKRRRTGRP
ncbi:hypothetical protein MMC10_007610 [Thelotrema lepadinum]|nr:hypothetical protein [Thelotrema lepadinum]